MVELGFALYLVTDRALPTRPLLDVVGECLDAGLRAVQLREKDLGGRGLHALASALRAATWDRGARLIVNDRLDVAMATGADGVQRTQASLPVSALRRTSPPGFLIGASVHSDAEALEAVFQGADFLLFGPVYDTPSKRGYGPPRGLDALGRVAAAAAVPVFAVGGVTPSRVPDVLAAGARGVAVISAILGAERPGEAVKAFLDTLGRA